MNPPRLASFWTLDPVISYLNHGGFGACPEAILEARYMIQKDFERNPLRFIFESFEKKHGAAKEKLSIFLGTASERLVFTTNATEGVNIVLKSLNLRKGDKLLCTNHVYPGCRAALARVAEKSGAEVVTVDIPFPVASAEEITERILKVAAKGASLALIDHVSSETAMIFPVKEICEGLTKFGVDTIIDGAHAPGMLPLVVDEIGAAWYTGNCHKWMCGPKTAGFLVSAPGRLEEIEPLITSFGSSFQDSSRHPRQWEFFWPGTSDASSFFVLPDLIDYMEGLLPGGWPEIREHNHRLILKGQEILCDVLKIPAPLPESMIGSMLTLPIPAHNLGAPLGLFREDRLGNRLYEKYKIEVPFVQWPGPGEFKIRISAQLYNSVEDFEALGSALTAELNR